MPFMFVSRRLSTLIAILSFLSNPELMVCLELFVWLAEFLHVKPNNCYTHTAHVISDVLNGRVLGSTSFILSFNDVADLFVDTDISGKLYADDIQSYFCINTTLPREHLNQIKSNQIK